MTRLSTAVTVRGGLPQRTDLRRWLSAIAWGIDAALASEAGGLDASPVIALPLWEYPGGRESRIRWDGGTIAAVTPGVPRDLMWRKTEGDTSPRHVVIVAELDGSVTVVAGEWPDSEGEEMCPIAADPATIITAGELAEWQLLDAMEPFIRAQVERCGRWVATEIGASIGIRLLRDNGSVIDGLTCDSIVTDMLYGGEDGLGGSVVLRMMRSYLADASDRVALTAYLERNTRARCEERVRRVIGDPGVGVRVRQIAAGMPDGSTHELLAECIRQGVDGGRLGLARVVQALTVASRVRIVADNIARHGHTAQDSVADIAADGAFEQVDTTELVRAYQARCGIDDPDLLWLAWNLEMHDRAEAPALGRTQFYVAAQQLDAA